MGGISNRHRPTNYTFDRGGRLLKRPTTVYGRPIPIVYGTARVKGATIMAGRYSQRIRTLNHSGQEVISYREREWTMLGLCEGPIVEVLRIWRDKEVGTPTSFHFAILTGTRSQAPWALLTAQAPSYALGYGGTAIAAATSAPTTVAGSVQSHDFEVRGLCATQQDGTSTAYDAHPADVLADLLTNGEYGAGWDPTKLDGYASSLAEAWATGASGTAADSWRRYCTAMGFFITMVVDDVRPLADYVADLMLATNSMAVWSNGKLKVIPLGDTEVTGNAVTYTPNVTPVYDLGASGPGNDFLADPGADPIEAELSRQSDAWNIIPVEFVNRNPLPITDPETGTSTTRAPYVDDVAEDGDPVDVEVNGPKRGSAAQLKCISRASHAGQISRLLVQDSLYSRADFSFRLGWRFMLLEPGDLVSLTEVKLGLDHKLVRIMEMEEDEGGDFDVLATEWTIGQGHAATFTTGTSDAVSRAAAAPPAILDALVFAPPLAAAEGSPSLWIGVAGAGVDFGGAQAWVSWDGGTTYEYVGDVPRAIYGTTDAIVADGPTVDASATISVTLSDELATLETVPEADRDALKTACWLDGEILAFKTAADLGGGHYHLTSLRRGALGTPTGAHASGAKLWRLDERVLSLPIPATRYGSTVRVKLVAFNAAVLQLADEATAPVTVYTLPSAKTGATFVGTLPEKLTFDVFDRTEWEIGTTDTGILSSQLGGIDGGGLVRCAGPVTMVHRALIPVDATKTYRVLARYRQQANQTVGGRDIKVGVQGVAEDGVTAVDLTGGTTLSSQHTLTANNAAATGWVELNAYWRGRAATGTVAGTLAAPGAFHTNVRYVRLMVQFNSAAGDGTQDLDALELDLAVAKEGVTHGAITMEALDAHAVSTVDYAEDSSAYPTAGVRMEANTVYPAWAANTAYSVGDRRTSGGKIFRCVTAGTSAGGAAAWVAGTTYGVGTLVGYSGSTYASLQAGNTNHQPNINPTWWESRGANTGPASGALAFWDGSAKWDPYAQLRVSPSGIQVGARLLSEAWFSQSRFFTVGGIYYDYVGAGWGANQVDMLITGLTWDATNKRLTIGFDLPSSGQVLLLVGSVQESGGAYNATPYALRSYGSTANSVTVELYAANGSTKIDWAALGYYIGFSIVVVAFKPTGVAYS